MKFILKIGQSLNYEKHKAKESFWNQHTMIDSFTGIRTIGLEENGSRSSRKMREEITVSNSLLQYGQRIRK